MKTRLNNFVSTRNWFCVSHIYICCIFFFSQWILIIVVIILHRWFIRCACNQSIKWNFIQLNICLWGCYWYWCCYFYILNNFIDFKTIYTSVRFAVCKKIDCLSLSAVAFHLKISSAMEFWFKNTTIRHKTKQ